MRGNKASGENAMNKIQKIALVMGITECSKAEAEDSLECNFWNEDAAINELLSGI